MEQRVHKYHRENYNPDSRDTFNIDAQALNLLKPHQSVLEIGCATGYLGSLIRKRYESQLWAVEIDPDAAEVARPTYENIIIGDIENLDIRARIEKKFDVIFMLAILFALRDPQIVLEFLRERLLPGGYLVLSVPNVVHWSNRWKTLRGKFHYEPYGLHDDKTARFYTKKTCEDLLSHAGWKIDQFAIDPNSGIPFVHGLLRRVPGIGPKLLNRFYSFAPEFWGYQFLIRATPK